MDSSNEDFMDDVFMKLAYLEGVNEDNDDDDFFQVFDDFRCCLPGGAGTSRIDRASPRPFIPSINGLPEVRIHFGMDGE